MKRKMKKRNTNKRPTDALLEEPVYSRSRIIWMLLRLQQINNADTFGYGFETLILGTKLPEMLAF
jgi:hypothetical protein